LLSSAVGEKLQSLILNRRFFHPRSVAGGNRKSRVWSQNTSKKKQNENEKRKKNRERRKTQTNVNAASMPRTSASPRLMRLLVRVEHACMPFFLKALFKFYSLSLSFFFKKTSPTFKIFNCATTRRLLVNRNKEKMTNKD
jgi:hypothetical protein